MLIFSLRNLLLAAVATSCARNSARHVCWTSDRRELPPRIGWRPRCCCLSKQNDKRCLESCRPPPDSTDLHWRSHKACQSDEHHNNSSFTSSVSSGYALYSLQQLIQSLTPERGNSDTAICITGHPRGVLSFTLPSILRHVVIGGNNGSTGVADVFVSAGLEPPNKESRQNSSGTVNRMVEHDRFLASLFEVAVHVSNHTELSTSDFYEHISTRPKSSQPFGHLFSGKNSSSWAHHSLLPFLAQWRDVAYCDIIIREHEAKRGFEYSNVMLTRMDYIWFADLPQIATKIAKGQNAVIPAGHSFNGYNDRFVLAERRAFSTYSHIFDALMSGEAPFDLKTNLRQKISEEILKFFLEHRKVSIKEVPIPTCIVVAVPLSELRGTREEGSSSYRHNSCRPSCPLCKKFGENIDALPSKDRIPLLNKENGFVQWNSKDRYGNFDTYHLLNITKAILSDPRTRQACQV